MELLRFDDECYLRFLISFLMRLKSRVGFLGAMVPYAEEGVSFVFQIFDRWGEK